MFRVDACRYSIFKFLHELKTELPVYYFLLEYDVLDPRNFAKLPRPGIFAWLQYRHQLDFDKSLWVSNNSTPVINIGINSITCDQFFATNGWNVNAKM